MTPENARNELLRKHKWVGSTLDVWLLANGRCEYCKTDLLASSDLYFRGGHIDHIIPDGGDDLENLALACAVCNLLKRRFDPRTEAADITRDALIQAATDYISTLRRRDAGRLETALALLRDCGMVTRGNTRAGSAEAGIAVREIAPNAIRLDEDWESNNAAFTCPQCKKVFIISGMLHKSGRDCPNCGQSTGRVRGGKDSGGSASIEWDGKLPSNGSEPVDRQ